MELDFLMLEPIREIMMRVINFIPTFVTALAILGIGYIITKALTKMLVSFMRTIGVDKVCTKVGITKVLKKGGINDKPSSLIGCLFFWTMMVGLLITTVKVCGLTVATVLLDKVLAYIPSILSGVFVLI